MKKKKRNAIRKICVQKKSRKNMPFTAKKCEVLI